jgi:hypothetical protein
MGDNCKKMSWNQIKISSDWTHFLIDGQPVFGRKFKSALKFHAPGLAPVEDETGWFFIDENGKNAFPGRFKKAWGFYHNRSAVEDGSGWYHIEPNGMPAYQNRYSWCGNFQENRCAVRDSNACYFHIHPDGNRLYHDNYRYAGDFKDGLAAVMLPNGKFKHINSAGKFIYTAEFTDLGVYHKGYATARDENGWFHIDIQGLPIYQERYAMLEPFYNGQAWAEDFDGQKLLVTV